MMHFGFSVVFSFIYVILVQYSTLFSTGQGSVYGIVIWILFHLLIMPIMKTISSLWNQPLFEHFSELLGHILWGFVIKICRTLKSA